MAQYFQALLMGPLVSLSGSKKLGSIGLARPNQKDLEFLIKLVESRKVVPFIDRRYPLSETAEAFRHYGEGHSKGKVVITV
jgi:NADPH:quinone reductase-like Zn-dependent oxidoreductase